MMTIDCNSDEEQVYTYLSSKCPFLVRSYARSAFEGIDGEVFLGLTKDTIEMIFPNMSLKEKGLLLARVEGARFGDRTSLSSSRTVTPATPRIMNNTSVTPPFTITTNEGEQKQADNGPENLLVKPQMVAVVVNESPAREVTPPITTTTTNTSDRKMTSVHLPGGEELLPRILVEFWRFSSNDQKEEFLAETWIPNLREIELRSETFRLALRRCIANRSTMKIVAARKWFGALILSGRYFRIDNRLELFVMEVKEIELIGWESDVYFFKLFSFVPGGDLNHVYTSNKLPIGSGRFNTFPQSSNSVEFDEQITMRFGMIKQGEDRYCPPIEPVIGATPSPSPSNRRRGKMSVENLNQKNFSVTKKILTPVSNVDVIRGIMMRSPTTPLGGASNAQYDRILSLHDLMLMIHNGSTEALDPSRNRFEYALLPTHEVSALAGTEFMLRSMEQVEALRSDSAYMRNHSQVIELLLTFWGFGQDVQTPAVSGWQGHTWLLRHALLSAIVLDNSEEAKRIVKCVKNLSDTRQIDLGETGFGEAVFTLDGDRDEARNFWDSYESHSGIQRIKSPYLPGERSTLSSLMNFVIKNGSV